MPVRPCVSDADWETHSSYSKRKHGFQFPLGKGQVAVWIFILFLVAIDVFSILYQDQFRWISAPNAVLSVASVICLIHLTLVDPVDAELAQRKRSVQHEMTVYECDICGPIHTSCLHCVTCNKCVQNWDHHCYWINNCVGSGNYAAYFLFLNITLIKLFLEVINTIALSAILITQAVENSPEDWYSDTHFIFGTIIILFTAGILFITKKMTALCVFHYQLRRNNLSTYNYIMGLSSETAERTKCDFVVVDETRLARAKKRRDEEAKIAEKLYTAEKARMQDEEKQERSRAPLSAIQSETRD